ncbi:NAD kinase 2, mitochondrial isoform X2 [Venturia canescens]|uniref:NAD kinase 2, mitochondrial isoform X2 n=1 Tax=Venturia canescens TaxID=32260 RepID=UPI001C9BC7D1|nr:NAD kinase 2, mitochondrial isoform X2 [Venturia canescens]
MTIFISFRRQASRTFRLFRSSPTIFKEFGMSIQKESSFVPKKVLVLAKVSRFDFERLREPKLNDKQIETKLLERGSDCKAMLESHRKNKDVVNQAVKTLETLNIEYKLTDRLSIDQASFDWADMILAIGGDGTFLLGANLVYDNSKPILGINSDPSTSEGYLMLSPNYTYQIPKIFEMLKSGNFNYLMRSRIRVTLRGTGILNPPFHMHEKGRILGKESYKPYYTDKDLDIDNCYIQRFQADNQEDATLGHDAPKERKLPWLALNEVFIGESLSARTSSLNIKVDDGPDFHKVKSSGLCISTGTGSSSWYRAINSLTTQMVKDILRVADPHKSHTEEELEKICTDFNNSLQFPADDQRMSYAIRDIIINDIWPLPKTIAPRDFCTTMTVQSQCYDADLVLDGGIGVPFNVGTTAYLTIDPEDALRTIVLED